MGMDSYLYRLKKETYEAYMRAFKKWREQHARNLPRIKELNEEFEPILKELNEKYPELKKSPGRHTLCKVATQDEMQRVDALLLELSELDVDINSVMKNVDQSMGDLLIAWRKPYGLHDYVRSRFAVGGEDNCTRIPIGKEGLSTMLFDMSLCKDAGFQQVSDFNYFGQDEYWNLDDLNRTMDIVKNAVDNYDDNYVIYYYRGY